MKTAGRAAFREDAKQEKGCRGPWRTRRTASSDLCHQSSSLLILDRPCGPGFTLHPPSGFSHCTFFPVTHCSQRNTCSLTLLRRMSSEFQSLLCSKWVVLNFETYTCTYTCACTQTFVISHGASIGVTSNSSVVQEGP